jgi:phosphoglycerate dehydrogenase-like enzyme
MERVIVTVNMEFRGRSPARELLEGAGFEVLAQRGSPGWPDEETRGKLAGVDAIIAGAENFNAHTMENAERLRIIARNGVGYDKVGLELCTERGVVVTNTPGAMADAVADHAIALLLSVVRHIVSGDRAVKEGEYSVAIGEDLAAMTLGLIGCGHIGAETARRALAFKMRVLVCDPWAEASRIKELGASLVSLEELQREADAISLHLPLTDDNISMVNADFLSRLKPGSFLINTARGGLVDEPALIEALQNGHLAGAGLDCQATEPPEGISLDLVRLPNVVAMPHSASNTITARERMSRVAATTIVDCLQGRRPEFVVNPAVLDKLNLKE